MHQFAVTKAESKQLADALRHRSRIHAAISVQGVEEVFTKTQDRHVFSNVAFSFELSPSSTFPLSAGYVFGSLICAFNHSAVATVTMADI